jgi:hypothetical protein
MLGNRLRSTINSIVAILCAASFLAMSIGTDSRADAAENWELWSEKTAEPGKGQKTATDANQAAKDWETWPKKEAKPVIEQKPATEANGAAKVGETAEKKTAKEKSSGTAWWIAAGTAVVIGIGIAIAAGGGGGGGEGSTNPGHQ